jgi:hypothetical protein
MAWAGALPKLGRDTDHDYNQKTKEMSRNSHDLLIALDKSCASCYLSERSERFVARSANAVSVHFATLISLTPPFLFFPSRIPLGRRV